MQGKAHDARREVARGHAIGEVHLLARSVNPAERDVAADHIAVLGNAQAGPAFNIGHDCEIDLVLQKSVHSEIMYRA